jgi:hypothetical protein
MQSDKEKKYYTTRDIVVRLRELGVPLQNFKDAVMAGKVTPYWSEGSQYSKQELKIVLDELDEEAAELDMEEAGFLDNSDVVNQTTH